MKTRFPRSSFHHAVVTSFGARRSISRAKASAQRRTSRKPHFGSMRQARWMPRFPDVVVSSRALHHFSWDSLEHVYQVVAVLTKPGGFVFDLDHVGSPDDYWNQP